MKKIDKHISISKELYDNVLLSAKTNHRRFSEELTSLLTFALETKVANNKIDNIEIQLNNLLNKNGFIIELLKQIYSDMDFNNLSDPKKSFALNEFLKKMRGDKIDS